MEQNGARRASAAPLTPHPPVDFGKGAGVGLYHLGMEEEAVEGFLGPDGIVTNGETRAGTGVDPPREVDGFAHGMRRVDCGEAMRARPRTASSMRLNRVGAGARPRRR